MDRGIVCMVRGTGWKRGGWVGVCVGVIRMFDQSSDLREVGWV